MKIIFTLFLIAFLPAVNAQYNWVQKNDFGGAARAYAVSFTIFDKGYIGTGGIRGTSYNDFWEYDPLADSWTQKADFGGAPRVFAVGFAVSGKGYIGMGSDSIGGSKIFKDFWEYNPLANSWIKKNDFPGIAKGRSGQAASFVIGSKAYIGSGNDSTNLPTKDFWEYNNTNDSWLQRPDLMYPTCGSIAFSIGSKGYFGSGWEWASGNQSIFWEYDPVNNSWSQKASIPPTKRFLASAFSIEGKGFVGMGVDKDSYSPLGSDFWVYNPIENTWAFVDFFPSSNRNGAVSLVIGDKAFLGFGASLSYLSSNANFYNDFWEFSSYPASVQSGITNEKIISVFPNPAKEQITVTGYYSFPADFTIYDISGKIALQKKLSSHYEQIDIHALPLGIFIYELTDASGNCLRGKLAVE